MPDLPRTALPMLNIRIGRVNIRLHWRGFTCSQWPYFDTHWTIASFGVGPFGVMLMNVWTEEEVEAFNARRRPHVFMLERGSR